MSPEKTDTFPEDFRDIVSIRNEEGSLPLIVGGHAVNLWASFFFHREAELRALGPFVSKDLDLLGDQGTVQELARRLNQPPRRPRKGEASPIVAWFNFATSSGVQTKIEVLFSVYGMTPRDLETGAAVIVSPQLNAHVRLPNPLMCLKMKTNNAVGLDQTGRQDVRHVKVLILCNRAFVREILWECESSKVAERAIVNAL